MYYCIEERLFWFSSLGQIIQFGTIKIWIEKKFTIIVAFHFMKRRPKIAKGSPLARWVGPTIWVQHFGVFRYCERDYFDTLKSFCYF